MLLLLLCHHVQAFNNNHGSHRNGFRSTAHNSSQRISSLQHSPDLEPMDLPSDLAYSFPTLKILYNYIHNFWSYCAYAYSKIHKLHGQKLQIPKERFVRVNDAFVGMIILIGEQNRPITIQRCRINGVSVVLCCNEATTSVCMSARLIVSSVTISI